MMNTSLKHEAEDRELLSAEALAGAFRISRLRNERKNDEGVIHLNEK